MTDFTFTGRIIAVGEIKRGTSASGNWAVQDYTIQEESDTYPMKMTFEVFGDEKINTFSIVENERITVHFRIDSKEYNGRRFNSIRAWKVERNAQADNAQPNAQTITQAPVQSYNTNEPPF